MTERTELDKINTMSDEVGWSDDFSKAPTDTLLWVYATDDQGYAYGQAVIWKRGNPGEPKLLWSHPRCPIDDGVEKPLMWHRMPKGPSLEVLDAVCLEKAPNTSAANHIRRRESGDQPTT